MCPCDWEYVQDEYIYNLEQDEEGMSFDNSSTHFWTHEIESLIEERNFLTGASFEYRDSLRNFLPEMLN